MVAGFGRIFQGQWTLEELPQGSSGEFKRLASKFRDQIRADGTTQFVPEADRYHLYICSACPWSHRTSLMRSLKGLEGAIGMTHVEPVVSEGDWAFATRGDGPTVDVVNRAAFMREIYLKSDPAFTGNVTVPVLWDKKTQKIVNNESREIIRMFDEEFSAFAENRESFSPQDSRPQIDALIDEMYESFNNGVYRAGFATRQRAYELAVKEVFASLDRWEALLSERRYLCGDFLTEADLCFFPTLLRFDFVYHSHFKCNIRRIADYPHLSGYLRELYQIPAIRSTCDIKAIKDHYFQSHRNINPTGIVPVGPEFDLDAPSGRTARLRSVS